MNEEKNVTLIEARETLHHLMQGVNPYTGEVFEKESFVHNPRMIRVFAQVMEVLTRIIEKSERQSRASRTRFRLTETEAGEIKFPKGDVGVKAVLEAVNDVINLEEVNRLTVVSLYKCLKEEGILAKSEVEGQRRTVTTKDSKAYGIITVKSTFQGMTYDKIMYTDLAKEKLRADLVRWFT